MNYSLNAMEKDCIFCKIRDGKIPKEFTYQDKDLMVFPDISPLKPIHLLIVPKKHIPDFLDLEDDSLALKIRDIMQKLIKENDLTNKGYRITVNGGGAQIVEHLHFHLTGPLGKAV